jgi:4-amino-4-deoxy-L-arabinose transferase-like glycosyltransferase
MYNTGLSRKEIYWSIAVLVLLYFLSVAINLGVLELDGEEPRRAIVSLEMMQSGRYFNPTQFGWPYYNKPAVFNWILIFFIRLFHASSEWVLRLPSLFFYLLWAAVHYWFAKQYLYRSLALLSAFFLLTSADIYFYGLANGAEIDIFYSFVVYVQAAAIFHFHQQRRWALLYLVSYGLCAIGFLTKGFPSLLFEGLTLIAISIYARSLKPLFKWQHIAGILLFVLITGSYFWAYSQEGNVQNLLVNFLNESLTKSAIGERSNKVFEKAIGYPFLLLKLVAPWSLLLLLLFIKKVRNEAWRHPLVWFSSLFILCNIWVYWLTGQPKARYVYMFAPFAAIIFVQALHIYMGANSPRVEKILRWFALVFVLAAIGLLGLPFFTDASLLMSIISAIIVGLFTLQYLRIIPALRIWALVAGIILLRLVYAVVFIPVQYRMTAYYNAPMQQAATLLKKEPLLYYAPPEPMIISLQTSLFSWKQDTVFGPKSFPSQISYYYYRHSGRLLRYDTALQARTNYVAYSSDVQGVAVDTVQQFGQKREANTILLYRPRINK